MTVVFPVMGAENISVSYLSSVVKNSGHDSKVAFDRALFDDKQYFSVGFLHRLFDRKNKMVDAIIREKPDVLLLIDSPEFAYRVAKRVRKQNPSIRIVKFVAPSVWAWRPGRARKIAPYIDHILALLRPLQGSGGLI